MYRYLCTQRPPAPGAIPRGAERVDYNEEYFMTDAGGHVRRVYGAVEYKHPLTEDEIEDYELVFDSED